MKTSEKLNLIKNFKLIMNIYEDDYQCHCGNKLSLLDLQYGDIGESFKCSCGEHYLLANADARRMSRDLEVDFKPYSKNLKARHDRLQEQYILVKNNIDAKRLKEAA